MHITGSWAMTCYCRPDFLQVAVQLALSASRAAQGTCPVLLASSAPEQDNKTVILHVCAFPSIWRTSESSKLTGVSKLI